MFVSAIDYVRSFSGQPLLSLSLEQLSERGSTSFSDLVFTQYVTSQKKYLLCTQKALRLCPPAGLVSAVRIVVSEHGDYEFQVLLKTVDKGRLSNVDDFVTLCLRVSSTGGYKFCPGVNIGVYKEKYLSVLHRDSKSVKILSEPFERVESPNCERWHKLARNSSILERDLEEVPCKACKKMCSHLDQLVRSALSVTPAKRAARQDPSSTCPISCLSPKSQKKRKSSLMHERVLDRKRLQKYEHAEVTLDDDQSTEMEQIVNHIEVNASDTLQQIFREADKNGKGEAFRDIWQSELRSEFFKDQSRNGNVIILCVLNPCLFETV